MCVWGGGGGAGGGGIVHLQVFFGGHFQNLPFLRGGGG